MVSAQVDGVLARDGEGDGLTGIEHEVEALAVSNLELEGGDGEGPVVGTFLINLHSDHGPALVRGGRRQNSLWR